MNTFSKHNFISDAQLVELSLAGNRDAFAQVVERYQSLVCGLSYSACGDVGRSEDLAQDTFVAAWQDLPSLKEPGKLKSWLCGIARNLINSSRRRELRSPTGQAESLPPELACENASPDEQAMSSEEELLVWRTLETIPPDYREPMVLFYREGQSTQAVAEALDLSEEAVRQRLSRGRSMLNERVAKTVETVLVRSAPGRSFVLCVLAALPALSISAKAATIGTAAAKGGGMAKAAAATGLVGALSGLFLSFFGIWFGYRSGMIAARSGRERAFIKKSCRTIGGLVVGFIVLHFVIQLCAEQILVQSPLLYSSYVIGVTVAFLAALAVHYRRESRTRRQLLAELTEEQELASPLLPAWEYRSKLRLLGLPFIHIRFGERLQEPVKAWIASGGCAYGVLFAFGGLAVAPISVGGCAVGLFSFGGTSVGLLALGGVGVGLWAIGGAALGWQAFGGCALAWQSALGGVAVAREFALGGIVHAAQANSEAAQQFLEAQWFFVAAKRVTPYLALLNLCWIIPLIVQRVIIRRRCKYAGIAAIIGLLMLSGWQPGIAEEAPKLQGAPSDKRFDELVSDDSFRGE